MRVDVPTSATTKAEQQAFIDSRINQVKKNLLFGAPSLPTDRALRGSLFSAACVLFPAKRGLAAPPRRESRDRADRTRGRHHVSDAFALASSRSVFTPETSLAETSKSESRGRRGVRGSFLRCLGGSRRPSSSSAIKGKTKSRLSALLRCPSRRALAVSLGENRGIVARERSVCRRRWRDARWKCSE